MITPVPFVMITPVAFVMITPITFVMITPALLASVQLGVGVSPDTASLISNPPFAKAVPGHEQDKRGGWQKSSKLFISLYLLL
jgi:hypothetical protein